MYKKSSDLKRLKLKNKIFLAPMHKVNDIAFRILCKRAGASLCWTELTNPKTKKKIDLEDKPAIQLACNKINGIKEFMEKNDKYARLWDLNLGCPSCHANKAGTGYALTNNDKIIEDILKEIRKNTKKPLTIKIRKMPLRKTKKILSIAEKYCDALIIHPRTLKQGYSGKADIQYAKKIKALTKLPIIYSGDIDNKERAEFLLKEFDYIMIGRKAIGNPSIFNELTTNNLKRIGFKDYIKLAKRYKIDFKQIKFQAINFTKGIKNARKIRRSLICCSKIKDINKLLKDYSFFNCSNLS